jgi:hypothetical protein
MFTDKQLDEIEARRSVADIPALVDEVRRFNHVIDTAFNLKEVRARMDRHHKNFMEIRGELMEKEEEFQAALVKLLEGEEKAVELGEDL